MTLEPLSPHAFAFIAQVEEAFATLLCSAVANETGLREAGLGGKLLYAGELDEPGRAFTVAANIAGAATLAACADPASAKQAMRDGVADFLVNSLDEALRILKNQLRKREAVAVCVSLASVSIEVEMCARGVVPDLTFSQDSCGARARWEKLRGARTHAQPQDHGAPIEHPTAAVEEEKDWLTWRVADSPALWLPRLDALVLDSLPPDQIAARLWLERAPRYLGRLAHNARTLRVTQAQAGHILARFGAAQIGVPIEITVGPWGASSAESLVP